MKISDLIKNKNYDYIELRTILPKNRKLKTCFVGACKSLDGELISLDDDTYSKEINVLHSEEWSNTEIKNGLTVVSKFC